jgi:hypothetical protein
MCKRRATYYLKDLDEGYNFSLNFTSIGGLHKKLWVSKVARVPILRIMGLLPRESEEIRHLGVAPMVIHREYYKGKVVASSKLMLW